MKVTLELPGMKPEDVKISIENQVLTIRGEKKPVERTVTLPSTVDAERIQATVDHRVLTVTLRKSEKAKPPEIPVRAGN